jgi:hypothetical protein
MKRIRYIGVALIAAFAMSAVVASAASAAAFHAEPTGGTFPAAVSGESTTAQVFTSGFAKISCEKAVSTGSALKKEEAATKIKVEYKGNCKANGIFAVAEPIKAEYEINVTSATTGTSTVVKPIVINVTGAGCTDTVFSAETKQNEKLKELTFTNNAAKTEITTAASVKGISSKGSGGICGTEEAKAGTYTGTIVSKLVAGGKLFVE